MLLKKKKTKIEPQKGVKLIFGIVVTTGVSPASPWLMVVSLCYSEVGVRHVVLRVGELPHHETRPHLTDMASRRHNRNVTVRYSRVFSADTILTAFSGYDLCRETWTKA